MAKVNKLMVGESLVGDGNEVAHIDLIIGPRGSAAESAFAHALTNNKDGFTALLAVVGPNLAAKPSTVMFNKVTIKGAKQAVQMFGPAQHAVAKAVADSVADGTIPAAEADDLFICVGVFIHWDAADDKKIHDFNYRATKESIARAVSGQPTPLRWSPSARPSSIRSAPPKASAVGARHRSPAREAVSRGRGLYSPKDPTPVGRRKFFVVLLLLMASAPCSGRMQPIEACRAQASEKPMRRVGRFLALGSSGSAREATT